MKQRQRCGGEGGGAKICDIHGKISTWHGRWLDTLLENQTTDRLHVSPFGVTRWDGGRKKTRWRNGLVKIPKFWQTGRGGAEDVCMVYVYMHLSMHVAHIYVCMCGYLYTCFKVNLSIYFGKYPDGLFVYWPISLFFYVHVPLCVRDVCAQSYKNLHILAYFREIAL